MQKPEPYTQADVDALNARVRAFDLTRPISEFVPYPYTEEDYAVIEWESERRDGERLASGNYEEEIQLAGNRLARDIWIAAIHTMDRCLEEASRAQSADPSHRRKLYLKSNEIAVLRIAAAMKAFDSGFAGFDDDSVRSDTNWGATRALLDRHKNING